jgi:hypothetical protein
MSEKAKGKGARAPSVKGKKTTDESEKLIVGNGWTAAATQKMLECSSIEERIQHLLQMFSISEQDYQYSVVATTSIDFHLANFLYCIEQQFDCPKTQFVCRTMHKMLELAISKMPANPEKEKPNYDAVRVQLFDYFQSAFQEWITGETKFTTEETRQLIAFVTNVLLRPLRLVLPPFYLKTTPTVMIERRKVFRPVVPVSLAECEEQFPLVPESRQFQPFPLPPNVATMGVEDMKQMIQEYAENMIAVIERRYDVLEEGVAKMTAAIAP